MKIIEISSQPLSASAQHMAEFAKEKSLPWEVELLPAYDADIVNESVGTMVGFSVSDQILSGLATIPTLVRLTDSFDSFIREGDTWYPRLLIFEALRTLVVDKIPDLDNRASGYIVGDNQEARIAAAIMADLGFSTIFVASDNEKNLSRLIEQLQRNFIGIDFKGVEAKSVISQKIQAGFLINCIDLTEQEDLKEDLSYFNFMKANGLVLDLEQANDCSLLEEASRASLRVISTADIYLQRDLLFLERTSLHSGFTENDFKDSWHTFLKSHPLSSYKKRHS